MGDTFCGWYFRCRSGDRTVALIPAAHTANGVRSGSLQIISDAGNWLIPFSRENIRVSPDKPRAVLGKSVFRENGVWLDLYTDRLSVAGELRFGPLSTLRYDVMGPFRYVPFMECRHSVASMQHTINGSLRINETDYSFRDGMGYIEGDRGHSFPQQYAWTQCFFESGSLVLSVAEIPLGPLRFTGVICVIHFQGREYRLATYLGAKAEKIRDGEIIIRQGRLALTAALLEKNAYFLKAPASGAMTRSIRENVSCRAKYRFSVEGRTVFAFETEKAAFEFEYPSM